MLKQALLDRPKVSSLAKKTDAISQPWKKVMIEVLEKFKDFFVGLETQVFTYDFHCKYFTISQLRQWASLSECSGWKTLLHKIVYLAKDIYDKIIKVHFLPSLVLG
jgi:hypothetical protein